MLRRLCSFHSFMATRRHPVQIGVIINELRVSKSTVYRMIYVLNSFFGANIYHDGKNGYVMDKKANFPDVYYGV